MIPTKKPQPNSRVFNSAIHLSLWACVCGTTVSGHSCSAELQAKGRRTSEILLVKKEFEHLGHGGAKMINETFEMVR
jgi:hypothetical protein